MAATSRCWPGLARYIREEELMLKFFRAAATCLVAGLAAVAVHCGGAEEPQVDPETEYKVELRVPAGHDRSVPAPLLVVLHGHEQSEKQAVGLWNSRFFSDPDFILASVRGPFEADDGYAWFTQSREVSDEWAVRAKRSVKAIEDRVLDAVAEAEESFEVDPDAIYVLGFSQGASAAFCVGLRNPDVFAGIAAIAGNLDTAIVDVRRLDEVDDMAAFIALGRGEGIRAVAAVQSSEALLSELGMDTDVFLHDGGHVITPEIVHEMQDFLGLGTATTDTDDTGFDDHDSEEDEGPRYLDMGGESDEYYEEEEYDEY
jgi:phospholipase/carboxylesterase